MLQLKYDMEIWLMQYGMQYGFHIIKPVELDRIGTCNRQRLRLKQRNGEPKWGSSQLR
jgi:hypothetical protein